MYLIFPNFGVHLSFKTAHDNISENVAGYNPNRNGICSSPSIINNGKNDNVWSDSSHISEVLVVVSGITSKQIKQEKGI